MVKIYYDKYGRIYASWNKRNDLLLGQVEVGDTFKVLYDDTSCDGSMLMAFNGALDDEDFLRDFTANCFKDELDNYYSDGSDVDIEYYVVEYKVEEMDPDFPEMDLQYSGVEKWSVTYSRKKKKIKK